MHEKTVLIFLVEYKSHNKKVQIDNGIKKHVYCIYKNVKK